MSRLVLSSLYQLTVVRLKLTLREPEAIFWIFVFPILLAVGLGIAFRNRPADVLPVGATTPQLVQALAADKGLHATEMDEAAGARALATGNILLLAVAKGDGVEYRYDNTIPDARTARIIADRAIQIAAGRRDPVAAENRLVHETGSRYIDFVVPGLLGMNLMGSAMWGLGFAIVNARAKKLLKRMVASPMPRWQYLASYLLSRLVMLAIEVVVLLGFALGRVSDSLSRFARGAGSHLRARLAHVFGAGSSGRLARPHHRGCQRPDERGHDAHVDHVGRLLLAFALPGLPAALRPGTSAHSSHQRHARQHAARDGTGAHDAFAGDSAGLVYCAVRGGGEDLQVALVL